MTTGEFLESSSAESITDRSLALTSAWSVAAQVLRMGTALVSVPIALKHLGADRYGLWMVSTSLMLLLSIIDAGISPAVKNAMLLERAEGNEHRFRYLSSGAMALGFSALVVGLVLAPVVYLAPWARLLRVPSYLASEATHLMTALFVTTLCAFSLASVESIHAATNSLRVVYIANLLSSLVSFALFILAIQLKATLPVLAITTAAAPVLSRVALIARLALKEPSLLLPAWPSVVPLARELLPGAGSFLSLQSMNVAVGAIPSLILARQLGLSHVAEFALCQRLASLPLVVLAAIMPVFWPAFSIAWSRGETDWVYRRLKLMILATTMVLAGFGSLLLLSRGLIAESWLRSMVQLPGPVLMGLTVWLVFQGTGMWLSTFLNGVSDVWYQVGALFAQAVSVSLLAGIGAELLGVLGVVVALAATSVGASVLPLAVRVRSHFKRRR